MLKLRYFSPRHAAVARLVNRAAGELHYLADHSGEHRWKKGAAATHQLGVLLTSSRTDATIIEVFREALFAAYENDRFAKNADVLSSVERLADMMQEVCTDAEMGELQFAELRDFCYGLGDAMVRLGRAG